MDELYTVRLTENGEQITIVIGYSSVRKHMLKTETPEPGFTKGILMGV